MAYTPTRRFAKLMFVFVTAAAVMGIGLHAGHAHGNALKAAKPGGLQDKWLSCKKSFGN